MRNVCLILILFTAGCHESTGITGRADAGADAPSDGTVDVYHDAPVACTSLWDCNPGVPCGDMVPCIDGRCDPDAERIWIECPEYPCTSDADCIVADPQDCCNGCPVVVHREELWEHECFYERGTEPGPMPEDCFILCYACPECYPQPLDAVCRSGVCVAGEEGCPYTGDDVPLEVEAADVMADPLAYSGETITVSGTALTLFTDCMEECLPPEPCCMGSLHLGGRIRLDGFPCESSILCWAEGSCPDEWDCRELEEGGSYEVTGELRSSDYWPSIWVEGIREVEPEGVSGAFDVRLDTVSVWSDDPGVDCAPLIGEGETGLVVLSDTGAMVMATASFIDTSWCTTYTGRATGSSFEVLLDIDCDYCDYRFDGVVDDDDIVGIYHGFDGVCHTEAAFTGARR